MLSRLGTKLAIEYERALGVITDSYYEFSRLFDTRNIPIPIPQVTILFVSRIFCPATRKGLSEAEKALRI
jgi:hypothetical protein